MENAVANHTVRFSSPPPFSLCWVWNPTYAYEVSTLLLSPLLSPPSFLLYTVTEGLSGAQRSPCFSSCQYDLVINGSAFPCRCLLTCLLFKIWAAMGRKYIYISLGGEAGFQRHCSYLHGLSHSLSTLRWTHCGIQPGAQCSFTYNLVRRPC